MIKYSLAEIVGNADRAYAAREEIQNVRESVELLRQASSQFDDYEVAWRLSRALFFLGQESQAADRVAAGKDPGRRQATRRLHAEGAKAGRRATRLQPERVDGHFWRGVQLALLADLERGFKAAADALLAKQALQKAIAIDAAYHAAGPLRVLARLQHKLPRWLGGGLTPARANFERAIGIAPANTVTRIYLAELLLEVGEATRARIELAAVVNAPFDPAWAFEIARDRLLAQEMLASLANVAID